MFVPDALTGNRLAQQLIDGLDGRKMRAQPAAVKPAPAPRHVDECQRASQQRQEQAQQNVDAGASGTDIASRKIIDAQPPGGSQQPCVARSQIEAEQIEHWRQHEQEKKPGLRQAACKLTMAGHWHRVNRNHAALQGKWLREVIHHARQAQGIDRSFLQLPSPARGNPEQ